MAHRHRRVDGSWTVVALKAECKSRGMVRYSNLRKADLIRALNADEGEGGSAAGIGFGAGAGRESSKEEGESYAATQTTTDHPSGGAIDHIASSATLGWRAR